MNFLNLAPWCFWGAEGSKICRENFPQILLHSSTTIAIARVIAGIAQGCGGTGYGAEVVGG